MSTSMLNEDPLKLKGKDRENWLKEKQQDLLKQVNEHTKSEKDLKELFDFMLQFHAYSLNNMLLIQKQWQGAYAVASYDHWNKLGFPVKTGEKGRILVWVRTPYKMVKMPNGDLVPWYKCTKAIKDKVKRGELECQQKVGFKTGFVYDISQTTATAEDMPKILPNRRYNFNDDNLNYEKVLEGVDRIANSIGYEMEWDERDVLGSAKGACYPTRKKILMNARNTPTETVSTSIHELAHAVLHGDSRLSRGIEELQAELTACLVSSYFGLDTTEKAVGYINNWTKGNVDQVALTDVLKDVQKTVKKFIGIINKELDDE